MEVLFCLFYMGWCTGVYSAGKAIRDIIGDREGFSKVSGLNDCQHRAEYLFLGNSSTPWHIGKYGWSDKISSPGYARHIGLEHQFSLYFTYLNIVSYLI